MITEGLYTENPKFKTLKVGDVKEGDFLDVETDGTMVNKGDGTCWDELSQPFVGNSLFTPAGRVDYNMTELTLDYAANARYPEEPVGVVTQLLHARKKDSDFKPHIHWMQTSNDIPNILVEYRYCNNGEPPTSWTLKALTDLVFAYDSSGNMMQISPFGLSEGMGVGKGLSSTFECKIYRDSANISTLFSGIDTYSGIWSAKYYDIHFEIDMNGSREEFVK